MAVLALEDFSSRIEVVVFPQVYNEYHTLLREDAVVEVEGRFNVDERGGKIIASRMALLEEGKPPMLSAQARNTRRGNGYGGGFNYGNEYSGNSEDANVSGFVNENPDAYATSLRPIDTKLQNQNGTVLQGHQSNLENQNGNTYNQNGAINEKTISLNNKCMSSIRDEQGHIKVPVSAIIELVITPERESEIVTKALIAILQKHHGSTMVFLKLMGSRRRIRLDPRYYVNGPLDDKDIEEFTEIPHAGRVKY